LLRDHHIEGVYGAELTKRFEIDTLVEFYNLLLVGAKAGFISPAFDKELTTEIQIILSHPSVIPYYKKHYPYKLTEYTRQYVNEKKYFESIDNDSYLCCFTDFISLNRMLECDKDIEMFLDMLDFVLYGEESIDEVIGILSSYPKLSKALTAKTGGDKSRLVWGFFKYTAFLSQFKELIGSIENNPLLQSAMWLYHGYFFDRMNTKMKSLFDKAFQNIEKALISPEVFSNIAVEVYGKKIPKDFDENEIQQYSHLIIQKSKEDILFVLDPKWKNAMEKYFED